MPFEELERNRLTRPRDCFVRLGVTFLSACSHFCNSTTPDRVTAAFGCDRQAASFNRVGIAPRASGNSRLIRAGRCPRD